jgi:hypothetical protein
MHCVAVKNATEVAQVTAKYLAAHNAKAAAGFDFNVASLLWSKLAQPAVATAIWQKIHVNHVAVKAE